MKTITKKLQYLLFAVVLLGGTTIYANWSNGENAKTVTANADEVVGDWDYTVENVPYEYQRGIMAISKVENNYGVKIMLDQGSLDAQDVVVKGNKIDFVVYVEGSKVSVSLTVEGDKISGKSSSMDGDFTIKGKRTQPE